MPASSASSRRSLANHWRILAFARGDTTKVCQSRDGPAFSRLGRENLDDFAVFELAFQRDEAAVDSRADAAVADLGVHRVGEVDRRRPGGQRDHVALRGEHEDLLHRKVVTQRLQELAGVGRLTLPVEQLTHPRHVVDLGSRVAVR